MIGVEQIGAERRREDPNREDPNRDHLREAKRVGLDQGEEASRGD